ncbi:MAG: formate dehydrogenase subunit delta [Hyphomicrobiales bacterium]|nr:formate dehydrogenase subunit delta [Hyphomicrobiales bacterium]
MDADKLVSMANQIADFFRVQGAGAEAAVADHIAKNWDPRMRAAIRAHAAAGGEGLESVAKAAIERLAG